MEQIVTKGDNAVIIACKGRPDITAVDGFKKEIKAQMESGAKNFIIDMEGSIYVDSSFLGALVASLRTVSKDGGDIKIANLKPHLRSIFELTRLHKLFDMYDSVEEAEAALK